MNKTKDSSTADVIRIKKNADKIIEEYLDTIYIDVNSEFFQLLRPVNNEEESFEEKMKRLIKARNLLKESSSIQEELFVLNEIAQAYYQNKNFSKAEDYYEKICDTYKALEIDTNNFKNKKEYVEIYKELKKIKDGGLETNKTTIECFDDVNVHKYSRLVEALKQNKALLDKIAGKKYTSGGGLSNNKIVYRNHMLGIINLHLFNMNSKDFRIKKAEQCFKKVLKEDATFFLSWYELRRVYILQSETQKAIICQNIAIKTGLFPLMFNKEEGREIIESLL